MVRYFLAALILIVTCSIVGQGTGHLSQKNSVHKAALFDLDLSAKIGTQEDPEPLDFIPSTVQVTSLLKALSYYCSSEQQFFFVFTRYSINTRAPPFLASV